MNHYFERYRRYRHYKSVRSELERLSDEDLIDAGIKRYQLGHIARVRVFKS
jgi:uncharacterized protein YjiS (DUF1127 family)